MKIKHPEPLTPAELKVMKIVWQLKECAARDVYQVTQKTCGWAPDTAKTVLRRLVDKGHLNTRQIGNSYLYTPISSMVPTLAEATEELLDSTQEGTTAALVFHMIKKGKLSQKDIQDLYALLKIHKQE